MGTIGSLRDEADNGVVGIREGRGVERVNQIKMYLKKIYGNICPCTSRKKRNKRGIMEDMCYERTRVNTKN